MDRRYAVSAPLLNGAVRDVEMVLDALSTEAINGGGVWVFCVHARSMARTIFTVKRTMFLTPTHPRAHNPSNSNGANEMAKMEFKGTPGPWLVGQNNPDGDDPYGPIPIRAGHYSLAKLHLDDAPVHDFNVMQRCNAKLIAAAPDHLSVALELDKWSLVILSAVRHDAPSDHDAIVALIKANRAAIAKGLQS